MRLVCSSKLAADGMCVGTVSRRWVGVTAGAVRVKWLVGCGGAVVQQAGAEKRGVGEKFEADDVASYGGGWDGRCRLYLL